MAKHPLRIFSLLFLLVAAAHSAAAEDALLALVIGNGNYGGGIGRLANPPSDARLVTAALQSAGFGVTTVIDADQRAMEARLRRFRAGPGASRARHRGSLLLRGPWRAGRRHQLSHSGRRGNHSQVDVEVEAVDTNWC